MPVTPGVIIVHLRPHYKSTTVHDLIDSATVDAPAGQQVRLHVDKMRPPAFLQHWCRPELNWQINAPDFATQSAWEDAIHGLEVA